MYKLSIDAMSGDLGSSIVVDACLSFIKAHEDVELYVTGIPEELEKLKMDRIHIIEARDTIPMDAGIMSVRRKKDSSMVKAVSLANEGETDGVVSCGSTGAFYTSAMLFMKRIEGIEKSCLMAILPTYNEKGVMLLDVGANAQNTPEQLHDFAMMGNVYAKYMRGIQEPKIALLNIGSESKKGDEAHQSAYQLLENDETLHFTGNIEGRDILNGDVDVIVSDGFSGNIALKCCEGTAIVLMKLMKDSLISSLKTKFGAIFVKDSLYALKDRFDYKSVGGALMMGFIKPVVKAHGASDAKAFYSAMELAYQMVKNDVVGKMKEGLNG